MSRIMSDHDLRTDRRLIESISLNCTVDEDELAIFPNAWKLIFILKNSRGFVECTIVPNIDQRRTDSNGQTWTPVKILWVGHPPRAQIFSELHWWYPLKEECQVRDFVAMIRRQDMDRYELRGDTTGYRFWLAAMIGRLEMSRLITRDNQVHALSQLRRFYSENGSSVRRPLRQGLFPGRPELNHISDEENGQNEAAVRSAHDGSDEDSVDEQMRA